MNTVELDDLFRVGPGTPTGKFMRQYWLPACLSSELVADGDPVRLRRLFTQAVRTFHEKGVAAPGVHDSDIFFGARSGNFLCDPAIPFEEAYKTQLEKAIRWSAAEPGRKSVSA